MFKVKVTAKLKMSRNVCPDDIFQAPKDFVTIVGIVIAHHELECHAKRIFLCPQFQGHSKGSDDQNMTVSTVSSELLIILLPNLV